MIDHLERRLRDVRRALSRSRWLGGLHDSAGMRVAPSTSPGLLIIQIDGLSAQRLRAAVAASRMPFVAQLLVAGELQLVPVYSGLPSTTPATEAELFYGVAAAVPAFTFIDHATGRLMRMYQSDAATSVESRIAAQSSGSLLAGGASYSNVYTGGATDARFCMASLGIGDVLPRHRRWLTPMLAFAYFPALVRVAALAMWELVAAPRDLLAGLRAGEDRVSEVKFLLSRTAVGVVLRELTVLGMSVGLARGLPVVHGNFLGYDENAHRRGPDSRLALRRVALDGRGRRSAVACGAPLGGSGVRRVDHLRPRTGDHRPLRRCPRRDRCDGHPTCRRRARDHRSRARTVDGRPGGRSWPSTGASARRARHRADRSRSRRVGHPPRGRVL